MKKIVQTSILLFLLLWSINTSDITLYPNPVSDELFLSTANKDISLASVSIINLSDGKQVLFKTINNDYSIIDLSNVMIGSYVVNMITSSGEQIQKKIQVIR
ncbi:T9SS type A sorting domain-containing protein [Haliscomenobacter sp.]|uniref:T9SS type A sorting domain-containing protein n=1 Tax=Haliscomenobacter sp. TaxID=2717303 RepID=UPI00359377AB